MVERVVASPADQLFRFPTQDFRRGRIHKGHPSLDVDADDPLAGRIEDHLVLDHHRLQLPHVRFLLSQPRLALFDGGGDGVGVGRLEHVAFRQEMLDAGAQAAVCSPVMGDCRRQGGGERGRGRMLIERFRGVGRAKDASQDSAAREGREADGLGRPGLVADGDREPARAFAFESPGHFRGEKAGLVHFKQSLQIEGRTPRSSRSGARGRSGPRRSP